MAGKRSIPTSLFSSPDFFELSSDTIRLIMLGLILDADDEGRGHAHPRLLARKLDKSPEDIAQALVELQAHGIVQCYEVAGRAYYVLCHWHTYQTLSKPTPSAYPAPPGVLTAEEHRTPPGKPRVFLARRRRGKERGRRRERKQRRRRGEPTRRGASTSSPLRPRQRRRCVLPREEARRDGPGRVLPPPSSER